MTLNMGLPSTKQPKYVTKPAVSSTVTIINPPASAITSLLAEDCGSDSFQREDFLVKMKPLSVFRAPVMPTEDQPAATDVHPQSWLKTAY